MKVRCVVIVSSFLLVLSCSSEEQLNLTTVMERYQATFTSIAQAIKNDHLQGVVAHTKEYERFFHSHLHQKWLRSKEPESRSRYSEIVEEIKKMSLFAQNGEKQSVRKSFSQIRSHCLDCHFITRNGNKKSFLDQELPDINY